MRSRARLPSRAGRRWSEGAFADANRIRGRCARTRAWSRRTGGRGRGRACWTSLLTLRRVSLVGRYEAALTAQHSPPRGVYAEPRARPLLRVDRARWRLAPGSRSLSRAAACCSCCAVTRPRARPHPLSMLLAHPLRVHGRLRMLLLPPTRCARWAVSRAALLVTACFTTHTAAFLCSPPSASLPGRLPIECSALGDLYAANGPQWAAPAGSRNWDAAAAATNPSAAPDLCTFEGVTCNALGRVSDMYAAASPPPTPALVACCCGRPDPSRPHRTVPTAPRRRRRELNYVGLIGTLPASLGALARQQPPLRRPPSLAR